MRKIITLLMATGLLLNGCGHEGDNQQTTPQEKIKTSASSAPIAKEEVKEASTNQISKSGQEMKNATEKLAVAVEEKATPMIEKVKGTATNLVGTIQEKTEPVVEKTKETTIAVVETVKEKTTPMLVTTMETATKLTNKATETVQSIGSSETQQSIPLIVTLDNKQGKIILPHKKHSESFECASCHQEGQPGPLTLGKEAGHALCQSCHKEQKAGPTKCSGCHIKTVRTPPEGC